MSQILDVTVDDTQINSDVKKIEENIEKMRQITANFNEFINNYAQIRKHLSKNKEESGESSIFWPE